MGVFFLLGGYVYWFWMSHFVFGYILFFVTEFEATWNGVICDDPVFLVQQLAKYIVLPQPKTMEPGDAGGGFQPFTE